MNFLSRLAELSNKLDENALYTQADTVDRLVARAALVQRLVKAYLQDDEAVIEFVNHFADSRAQGWDEIIWSALEAGMPDVYQAIDKDIDTDMVWRAIAEMMPQRMREHLEDLKESRAKTEIETGETTQLEPSPQSPQKPNVSDFMNPL